MTRREWLSASAASALRGAAAKRPNIVPILAGDNGKRELQDLAADPPEQRGLLGAWEQDVRAPRLAGFRPAAAPR